MPWFLKFLLRSEISLSLILIVMCVTIGCGAKAPLTYPVKGRVTYPDGTPVVSGLVEFELVAPMDGDAANLPNARGNIQEDGSYKLTTYPHDGAVAGRHRVIIQEAFPDADLDLDKGEAMPPQAIATKYRSYETSGLEFEVEEKENDIPIVVTRP